MRKSRLKRAVVLLSGGMDSATALYWAKRRGYGCLCLLFDYGQRHKRELRYAEHLAKTAGCPYHIIRFRLPWSGKSSLTDPKQALPRRALGRIGRSGIPSTYVPGRNSLFLAYALSCADAWKAEAVVIGANALDFSGYPDCRPQYYRAFRKVAAAGTRLGAEGKRIRILTPLLHDTKARIVARGISLRVPFEKTWSCYQGRRHPCGFCDACRLRKKGFREAGIPDPLLESSR